MTWGMCKVPLDGGDMQESVAHHGLDGYGFARIVTVERDFRRVEGDNTTLFELASRNASPPPHKEGMCRE